MTSRSGLPSFGRPADFQATVTAAQASPRLRLQAVRLLDLHDRRAGLTGSQVFGDPSWHMLLALFVRTTDGKTSSVGDACEGSRAPYTTALRHIGKLESAGLLVRRRDPCDARRTVLDLTSKALEDLIVLLGQVR